MSAILKLPERLRRFFWDCDPDTLTWERNESFVIRRILDQGDLRAIQWLRATVGDDALRRWFLERQGRGLDPRRLRFWGLILGLPTKEVDRWVHVARESIWHGRINR